MRFKELFKQFHRLQHSWLYTLQHHAETSGANVTNTKLHISEPEYNIKFLCDPGNRDVILNNMKARKSIGDIDKVLELSGKPEKRNLLSKELSKIPNCTHPAILEYGDTPKLLKKRGKKPEFDFEPEEFSKLASHLQLTKTNLGPVAGQRAYMFMGDLAQLEEVLVHYTVRTLLKNGFQLLSVPDIIPTELIKRCGLITEGVRTIVYNLDSYYGDDYSLSGTAEMALAGKMMNATLSCDELPLKLAAVSRCYRAEISTKLDERGIYRVHQFTKVEMFVCCEPHQSEEVFHDIQNLQEELFSSLGLHFQVMDMPPSDLGASAYRKIDIEAWMPGRKMYGELSSCSNCTDYQSRRLNIKYKTKEGKMAHVYTLNGTACAIPRTLIALCESFQTKHARIAVPNILVPLMKGKTLVRKQSIAATRPFKYKQNLSESDV